MKVRAMVSPKLFHHIVLTYTVTAAHILIGCGHTGTKWQEMTVPASVGILSTANFV